MKLFLVNFSILCIIIIFLPHCILIILLSFQFQLLILTYMQYLNTSPCIITSSFLCSKKYYILYYMTCSISKGFVIYHGYLKCELNYNYNYMRQHLTNSKLHVGHDKRICTTSKQPIARKQNVNLRVQGRLYIDISEHFHALTSAPLPKNL